MKNRFIPWLFLIVSVILISVAACHKSSVGDAVRESNALPEGAVVPPVRIFCNAGPDYGNPVICPKWRGPGNDYIIHPQNNPGTGTYFAWPNGLMIDNSTGAINVSKSETGARYLVGFVKAGTTDTCTKELILGGVTYADSIYVLANNDSLAIPYYNADPSGTPVCGPSDDNDYPLPGRANPVGNNRCEFDDDDDDDNGNGQTDEPPPGHRANDQHVRVRTTSGVINLKRSLEEGIFGTNPQNGDSKEVSIYYRLNDCSNKALQKINIRLIYFNRKSDVPQSLMNDVRAKRASFMSSTYLDSYLAPRPPQIIVIRYAEEMY